MATTESQSVDPSCEFDRLGDRPEERADSLRQRTPATGEVAAAETVFKALGNRTRLRILEAFGEGELCGCELEVALDAPQSTVASHLRTLNAAGLVTARRDGKWRYYRLTDGEIPRLVDRATSLGQEA